MKFFQNLIIRKAESIKAKQEAKQKSERLAEQNQYEANRKIVENAKEILYRALDPTIKSLREAPCHIKAGDVAILNRYNMLHPHSQNGWDGGPGTFLSHCHEDDRNTPINCDIISIHVDCSFAHEKIEKWIDNQSYEKLEQHIKLGTLKQAYFNWFENLTPSSMLWKSTYGLYRTAMFKAHFTKFNPSWGLNVGSFLEINTPEAKETHKIWSEEIQLEFAYKTLKEQTNKIEARKREIDEQYRNIRYIN
jgi:hypothetical protein